MRAVTVVTALVAGTAARLLFRAFPRHRSRRRFRRLESPSPQRRPRPPPHPHVAALLSTLAPPLRADRCALTLSIPPDAECSFCLEPIRPSPSTLLRVTPCAHVFHAHCLEQWVFFTAAACLDWTRYSLADDGSISAHVRAPTCPNCAAALPVLPAHLVRRVMLTAVARSLSLPDLATAAEMYDAGLVYRASAVAPEPDATLPPPVSFVRPPLTYPHVPPSPPAFAPAPQPRAPSRRDEAPPPQVSAVRAPARSAVGAGRESATGERCLHAVAFVVTRDGVAGPAARRSLPQEKVASWVGFRSWGRGETEGRWEKACAEIEAPRRRGGCGSEGRAGGGSVR